MISISTNNLKAVYEVGYNLLQQKYASSRESLDLFKQQLYKPTVIQRLEREGRKKIGIADLYEEILLSLRNRLFMANVVKEEDVSRLKKCLQDFNPHDVVMVYKKDSEIKRAIRNSLLKPVSQIQLSKYARGAYEGAKFLCGFDNAEEFFRFANQYDKTIGDRWMLATHIATQINGMGTALACNFLKEIGLVRYSKPDTQVIGLLKEADLSPTDQYAAFWTMSKIAEAASVNDYTVDKVLWLIATSRWTEDVNSKMSRNQGAELKNQFVSAITNLNRGN